MTELLGLNISTIVSLMALAIAIWSALNSWKVGKQQIALNQAQLDHQTEINNKARKADFEARFVNEFTRQGRPSLKLEIMNTGQVVAKNVCLDLVDQSEAGSSGGRHIVLASDVKQKFPMSIIQPNQIVRVIASQAVGSDPKETIKISWDDQSRTNHVKTYVVTTG